MSMQKNKNPKNNNYTASDNNVRIVQSDVGGKTKSNVPLDGQHVEHTDNRSNRKTNQINSLCDQPLPRHTQQLSHSLHGLNEISLVGTKGNRSSEQKGQCNMLSLMASRMSCTIVAMWHMALSW